MMYQQWIKAGKNPSKHSAMLIQKSAEHIPLLIATGTNGKKIPIKANNQSLACIVAIFCLYI